MNTHNFILGPVDTDSISICKPDGAPFTEEEMQSLLDEINSYFPEHIKYADDGYFPRCVALKAKNYILYDGKKIKIKGSSLKASTKSEALKEFTNKVIEIMIHIHDEKEMHNSIKKLYEQYVQEIMNITEIKRWSARKTLSSTMIKSDRANETKVIDAIKGSDYREGDRFFVFYLPDDSLCLCENFNGEYNKVRLLKNLYDTITIFDTVLPVKELFLNYSLKRNLKILLDNPTISNV